MTDRPPLLKTCRNCMRIKGGWSCRQYPGCGPLNTYGWKGSQAKPVPSTFYEPSRGNGAGETQQHNGGQG